MRGYNGTPCGRVPSADRVRLRLGGNEAWRLCLRRDVAKAAAMQRGRRMDTEMAVAESAHAPLELVFRDVRREVAHRLVHAPGALASAPADRQSVKRLALRRQRLRQTPEQTGRGGEGELLQRQHAAIWRNVEEFNADDRA